MNKENTEKTCLFYASDYHFEMIVLPYINKELDKNNNIVVLTENNLENTVNTLLSKMNLNKNSQDNILNINWTNNNENKLQKLQNTKMNNKTIIFIKGTQNYIKNINNDINNLINNEEVKIIDCYDINEIKGDAKEIVKSYDNILSTAGKKEFV